MDFWNYWLDNRAWGLGRPLLFSLPLVYLTWQAINLGAPRGDFVALVLLWLVAVQEWLRWKGRRSA